MKWPRAYASAAVVAAIIFAILFVPLPRRVKCALQVQAHDPESIYVHTPGSLTEVLVKTGDEVAAGQPLARLSNPALTQEMDRLTSELEQLESQRSNLSRQKNMSPEAADQIPAVDSQIRTVKLQIEAKAEDVGRLTLTAPIAGTVLPSPFRPERPVMDRVLRSWSGSIFDKKNQGMYLDVSQSPVVQIGDPTKFDAILAIDQADIDFITVGQETQIKLDALTWKNFDGKIDEKSKRDMEVSPRAMGSQAGGGLAVYQDAAGVERPMNATYQATVSFADPDGVVGIGYRGKARVRAGSQTLGARLWRYLARTFHFYM